MPDLTHASEDSQESVWSLDLRGSSPLVLPDVRHWIAAALGDLGATHLADIVLIGVELVTNTFDHAGGPREFRMSRVRLPCSVGIEVDDDTTDPPVLGHSRFPGQDRGRGLVLVDNIAHAWGMTIHSDTSSKTIWADVTCGVDPCR